MRFTIFTLVSAFACASAPGEVVTYECDVPPLDAGWDIGQNFCNPQEWVQDGQFFQYVELCPGYDPPVGQNSSYERSLADFAFAPAFWVEWVVVTDGDSSELDFTAPAALVFGNGPVIYHFTIADDQVRFIRSLVFGKMYFDIAPGMTHKFRVELFPDKLYIVYIDYEIVDYGVPVDELPPLAPESFIRFRAKAKLETSTTVWQYIRWGHIPLDASGDFDSDGMVGVYDLYFFQECLSNSGESVDAGPGCRWADFDSDADVDCADWQAFHGAWTDPSDPPGISQCDCPADLSLDGTTNAGDLAQLLGAWGANPEAPADLTGDNMVDASDLAILLGAWGPCNN